MNLNRGCTTTGAYLQVTISTCGKTASVTPIQHGESEFYDVRQIHKELNKLLDWHRTNDQPLYSIFFHLSPTTPHFAAYAIGQWIATAELPLKIACQTSTDANTPLQATLRKGDWDILWEDDHMIVTVDRRDGKWLAFYLREGGKALTNDGLNRIMTAETLSRIMQRGSLLAARIGTREIYVEIGYPIDSEQHALLEAAARSMDWPDSLQSIEYRQETDSRLTPLRWKALEL